MDTLRYPKRHFDPISLAELCMIHRKQDIVSVMEAQTVSQDNVANIAVVVPCYNEADRLDVDAFMRFTGENPEFSFFFVNDGSTDATAVMLQDIQNRCASVSVLTLQKNSGKAEAVRQGMLTAADTHCDYLAFIDADLSTPLPALHEMLCICKAEKRLLVSAARIRMLGQDIRRSGVRHYLGRIFATVISFLFGLHVYDTQCGSKIFRNEQPIIRSIFATPFCSRWIFDVEIFLRLKSVLAQQEIQLETKAKEMPLEIWHDPGGSRMHWMDFARIPYDILHVYFAYHTPTATPQTPPLSPPPPCESTRGSPA